MEQDIQRTSSEHQQAQDAVIAELDRAVAWAAEREGTAPCIAVSACLLGTACRYDGQSRPHEAVQRLAALIRQCGGSIRRICPESSGRLPQPRPPAEQQRDGRVLDCNGHDMTDAFMRGAERSVELVQKSGARLAVLKAKSPSCGIYTVYDGTFSRVLIEGMGVCARALATAGIVLADETDVELALTKWDRMQQSATILGR